MNTTYIVKVAADGRVEREEFRAGDALAQLQEAVGGRAERVSIPMVRRPDGSGHDLFVDGDAIEKRLPYNFPISRVAIVRTNKRVIGILGPAVFSAHDVEGDAIGLTEAECADVERVLARYGAKVAGKEVR